MNDMVGSFLVPSVKRSHCNSSYSLDKVTFCLVSSKTEFCFCWVFAALLLTENYSRVWTNISMSFEFQISKNHELSTSQIKASNADPMPYKLNPHQSLGDVSSSCQWFEMSAVIDQLHLLQVQSLQNLLARPVHHVQLFMAVHQDQRTTVNPLQKHKGTDSNRTSLGFSKQREVYINAHDSDGRNDRAALKKTTKIRCTS